MAAKEGDKVSVHYTGQLEDGSVFDSSRERDPMTFQLGGGQVVPGFERAVLGLEVGESVTRTIPCQEAYGERNDEDPVSVSRDQFPDGVELSIGQSFRLQAADEQFMVVWVSALDEQNVFLDNNHPLAGKALTFEIELVAVQAG